MPHQFTLILKDVTELDPAIDDRLYEAGCDDALLWSRDGVVGLHFDREAKSLADAIASARNAVERAGYRVGEINADA